MNAMDKPPFETLAGCDQRTLRHCASLERLVSPAGQSGAAAQAQTVAAEVLTFFDVTVPRHHADEEQDLFPALRESMAGSDAVCLREMTERLVQEHRDLDKLWSDLQPAVLAIAQGRADALPARAVQEFVARCRAHVELESGDMLPTAQRLLSDEAVAAMAAAMAARRANLIR